MAEDLGDDWWANQKEQKVVENLDEGYTCSNNRNKLF